MFYGCSSLKSLPDISKWNTDNIIDINNIFSGCELLEYLPDISKWNTSKITNMQGVFSNCLSLKKIPDISKWNTNNVEVMSNLFDNCCSLSVLPNISKWNFKNVEDISRMFYNCNSLISSDMNFLTKFDLKKMNLIFTENNFSSKTSNISLFSSDKKYIYSNISSDDDNNLCNGIIFEDNSSNIFYNEIDDEYYDNFYN